jgi:hypothetical protein
MSQTLNTYIYMYVYVPISWSSKYSLIGRGECELGPWELQP